MAIQIGAKPDSGFDDPIGMLKDCHRDESFLGILCTAGRSRSGWSLEDAALFAYSALIVSNLLKINMLWWRRRESNPRPKSLSARRIHAQSSSGWFRSMRSERTRCA